jgi:hypothetical protein
LTTVQDNKVAQTNKNVHLQVLDKSRVVHIIQVMTWQKFENTNQRFEDRISISTNYSFGFPKTFYERNGLETYKYLVIFFNPEENAVGFQFTNSEDEKHKFNIFRSKEKYGINITAKSFFKTYNLDPNKYKGKYTSKKEEFAEAGTLYVINLNENQEHENVLDAIRPPEQPLEINMAEAVSSETTQQ